jgi:folylpolyglutamate synthase/dihydropteroate synthase
MDALLAAAEATGVCALAAESVGQAMQLAAGQIAQRVRPGVVVVSGSVYLVGEARTLLLGEEGVRP